MSLIPGTGLLDTLKGILVGVLIGVLVGFGSGFFIATKIEEAKDLRAAKQTIKEDAKAPVVARKAGDKLAKDNATLKAENERLRDALDAAIPATPTSEKPNANCPVDAVRLTTHAVGLLNRALSASAPDPSGWSDAEKRTFEAVGMQELSQKVREVAGQYRDLAARHDGLVEDVSNYQDTIAKIRKKQ